MVCCEWYPKFYDINVIQLPFLMNHIENTPTNMQFNLPKININNNIHTDMSLLQRIKRSLMNKQLKSANICSIQSFLELRNQQ